MERFEELKERIDKFTKDRNWEQFHTPVNLAKSISIEAAELLECFQWSNTEFDKEHLLEELADVMNYSIQLSLVLAYDKDGELHYDIISAFIKSIRGSDPDAALYWLARMVAAGEDPKFIARRLVISASEDIGLANPNAMLVANACFDTLQKIGWPAKYNSLGPFSS